MSALRMVVLAVSSLVMGFIPSASLAQIVTNSGPTTVVTPPPSVTLNAFQSDTAIRVFQERVNVTLAGPLSVNFTAPGTYTVNALGTVAAGMVVDSYFFHFNSTGPLVLNNGSVTFGRNILGVMVLDAQLDASDPLLGAPGTTYPTGVGNRGLDFGIVGTQDRIIISGDRRTLTLTMGANQTVVEQVRVVTEAEASPPTANAGADQSIHAGQLVTLDGSGSFDDNTATEYLLFAWTLISKPDGSSATLASADTATPSFVADVLGEYAASLTVTDADGLSSAPDTVVVSSLNSAPVADAGPDQGTFVGDAVTLDGSASHDPDLDRLEFSWTLAAPAGSAAALTGETTVLPIFTPDVPGSYAATLTVNDPFGGISTDSVVVSVITAEQFAESQTVSALNVLGALAPTQVTTRGNQHALQKLLTQAIAALQVGNLDEARVKLTQAIERTDGCVLRGSLDGNGPGRDWVTDCGAQATLYQELTAALDALTP